jgi:hypothetical protein
MSSYDLETRRLMCSERIEQLSRDARRSMSRRRRRRSMRIALSRLALRPSAYRASGPSLGSR